MGIDRLLPDFTPFMTPYRLEDMIGKIVAIDISVWMHKGMYADGNDPMQFVYNQVDHLLRFKVVPILVFDGEVPDAKDEIVNERKRRREKRYNELKNLLVEGSAEAADDIKRLGGQRTKVFTDCIKQWCRTKNVRYIQSPCEADSQLAYLMLTKSVDLIITEDSDLIVYGCERILFKYKQGKGLLFEQSNVEDSWGVPFELECFRAVCIAMGCDYLKGGIPQFGPAAARKLYEKISPYFDFENMIDLIVQEVDEDFEEKFFRAVNTFKYQLVFDPVMNKIIPLTKYPDGMSSTDYPFAGYMNSAEGQFFNPIEQSCLVTVEKLCPRSFHCRDCPEIYQSCKELWEHRNSTHSMRCKVCQATFSKAKDLTAHMKTHTVLPQYLCDLCGHGSWTSFYLWMHRRVVHREAKYKCFECGQVLKTKQALINHKPVHSEEKNYQCSQCPQGFKRIGCLHAHERRHKDDQIFHCKKCDATFKDKKYLKAHEEVHRDDRPYKCKTCGAAFKVKDYLSRHERIHRDDRPYKCDQCQADFKYRVCLMLHKKGIHSEERPFKCTKCELAFKFKSSLTTHLREQHTNEKPHVCQQCGSEFKRAAHLKKHLMRHKKDDEQDPTKKPYNCVCGKRYTRNEHLTRHKKTCKLIKQNETT